MITRENLHIDCKIGIFRILSIEINQKINQHAEAVFEGITTAAYSDLLHQSHSGEMIALYESKEKERNPIFYGVIQDIVLYKGSDFTKVTIHAKSLSYMMDIFQKNRSFQNMTSTFTEVMESVIYGNPARAIYHIDDARIQHPFIQYQETDWEFMKRLASNLNAPLIVDTAFDKASIYVGLHKGQCIGDFTSVQKEVAIKEEKYIKSRTVRPVLRKPVYEFWSENIYSIGDYFDNGSQPVYVLSRKMVLKDSVLQCFYELSEAFGFYTETIYNWNLKGISITGEVLETKDEVLKLHL